MMNTHHTSALMRWTFARIKDRGGFVGSLRDMNREWEQLHEAHAGVGDFEHMLYIRTWLRASLYLYPLRRLLWLFVGLALGIAAAAVALPFFGLVGSFKIGVGFTHDGMFGPDLIMLRRRGGLFRWMWAVERRRMITLGHTPPHWLLAKTTDP